MTLARNRALALAALVLGGVALLGNPYQGSVTTVNTKELANIVEGKVDHVYAVDLADWIIRGDTEYRLIDIRDETAYAEYHIPTAESVPIGRLTEYPLLRNERIVLYSDGGIHSAQAWFLLKAQGFQGVYMLFGGLDAWKDEVLFPALPADATVEQQADFERARFVSAHFGGTPRTGVEETIDRTAVPLPKVEAPARGAAPTQKKKKKEGC